jgi:hypothetical protein
MLRKYSQVEKICYNHFMYLIYQNRMNIDNNCQVGGDSDGQRWQGVAC